MRHKSLIAAAGVFAVCGSGINGGAASLKRSMPTGNAGVSIDLEEVLCSPLRSSLDHSACPVPSTAFFGVDAARQGHPHEIHGLSRSRLM